MTGSFSPEERRDIEAEFHRLVNLSPAKLRAWLATDDSRSVGMTAVGERVTGSAQPEAVGHHMGERILESGPRNTPT